MIATLEPVLRGWLRAFRRISARPLYALVEDRTHICLGVNGRDTQERGYASRWDHESAADTKRRDRPVAHCLIRRPAGDPEYRGRAFHSDGRLLHRIRQAA